MGAGGGTTGPAATAAAPPAPSGAASGSVSLSPLPLLLMPPWSASASSWRAASAAAAACSGPSPAARRCCSAAAKRSMRARAKACRGGHPPRHCELPGLRKVGCQAREHAPRAAAPRALPAGRRRAQAAGRAAGRAAAAAGRPVPPLAWAAAGSGCALLGLGPPNGRVGRPGARCKSGTRLGGCARRPVCWPSAGRLLCRAGCWECGSRRRGSGCGPRAWRRARVERQPGAAVYVAEMFVCGALLAVPVFIVHPAQCCEGVQPGFRWVRRRYSRLRVAAERSRRTPPGGNLTSRPFSKKKLHLCCLLSCPSSAELPAPSAGLLTSAGCREGCPPGWRRRRRRSPSSRMGALAGPIACSRTTPHDHERLLQPGCRPSGAAPLAPRTASQRQRAAVPAIEAAGGLLQSPPAGRRAAAIGGAGAAACRSRQPPGAAAPRSPGPRRAAGPAAGAAGPGSHAR